MFNNLNKFNFVRLFNLRKVEKQAIFIIAIIITILINLLLSTVSFKLDLSSGKAYTLSQATKKIIKDIQSPVDIKFYISSDLPTRLMPVKTDVVDLLNEYKKESGNKIRLSIVDPKKDTKVETEAKEQGIPELQFSQLEKDKYAVTTAYFGIVLSYNKKNEVIPQATDIGSLEYNLTSSIYKLSQKQLGKVAILGYEETVQQGDPLQTLRQVLNRQYTVDSYPVSKDIVNKLTNDYKTLFIFGRDQKYEDEVISKIKSYLSHKGTAIFFVDGIDVGDSLTTSQANHNLFSLLSNYGLTIEHNLLLSTSAELVNFGNETINFFTPYPFWVKTNMFDTSSGYFTNVDQLTYPWTSSINIKKKNNNITALVKTSPRSWQQNSNFSLNPQTIPQPAEKDLKQFIVAAQASVKGGGTIIVIPSSRFVQDAYLSRNSSNIEFILNAVNDLASNGALTGIRQRAVNLYPVPDLPDNQKDIFKYSSILLFPIIFIIYGVYRLVKRK